MRVKFKLPLAITGEKRTKKKEKRKKKNFKKIIDLTDVSSPITNAHFLCKVRYTLSCKIFLFKSYFRQFKNCRSIIHGLKVFSEYFGRFLLNHVE